jgi:hypothetical protein
MIDLDENIKLCKDYLADERISSILAIEYYQNYLELLLALEEAKEILSQPADKPTIYVYGEAQKWLSKYFSPKEKE